MKIIQVVSKSSDGRRAEVVVQTDKGLLRTKHIHKGAKNWTYCERIIYKKNRERKFIIKNFATSPSV